MTDLNWKEIPRWIVESSKLLRGKDDSFNYQHCCNSTCYHLGWEFDVGHLNNGLRTPNEGINQRYLKNWADVEDKICFGRT